MATFNHYFLRTKKHGAVVMSKQHTESAAGVEKEAPAGKDSSTPTIEIYFDGQFGTDNNTGTLFANGQNEAHIVVRYTIPPLFPPPTQFLLVDPASPGTVYGPDSTMDSKQWVTKTTPGQYVKWFPYLNTDNPITAESRPAAHIPGTKADTTYYTKDLYISRSGRNGGSLYSMAAAIQFGNNGWFYSTSGGSGKLFSIQVGLREPLTYSIDDLQGYGSAPSDRIRVDHLGQRDDNYYDKNDPHDPEVPGNCWRQNDYVITLKNKFDISDYFGADGRSDTYIYATRARNYYRTYALLWDIGQAQGKVNLWKNAPVDSGGGYWPRSIQITQGSTKGVTISLLTYVCLNQISLDNSANVSDPRVYFHDAYGNEGSFSLNMDIPKYYKDIIDSQTLFRAITPSSNTFVMRPLDKGSTGFCFNGSYGYITSANDGFSDIAVRGWQPTQEDYNVYLDAGGPDQFPAAKINFVIPHYAGILESDSKTDGQGDAKVKNTSGNHPDRRGVFLKPMWLSNGFRVLGYRNTALGYWKAANSGSPRLVYASNASYAKDGSPDRFYWRFVDFNLE